MALEESAIQLNSGRWIRADQVISVQSVENAVTLTCLNGLTFSSDFLFTRCESALEAIEVRDKLAKRLWHWQWHTRERVDYGDR